MYFEFSSFVYYLLDPLYDTILQKGQVKQILYEVNYNFEYRTGQQGQGQLRWILQVQAM